MSVPLLHKPEGAADQLHISRATLFELLKDGAIESVTIGRSRRIPHAALLDYVEKLRAKTFDEATPPPTPEQLCDDGQAITGVSLGVERSELNDRPGRRDGRPGRRCARRRHHAHCAQQRQCRPSGRQAYRRSPEGLCLLPSSIEDEAGRRWCGVSAAPVEVEVRKGNLIRLTHDRSVVCVCIDCGFCVSNTGAASSHVRRTRHRVEVAYYTSFAFVPAETVAEAGS